MLFFLSFRNNEYKQHSANSYVSKFPSFEIGWVGQIIFYFRLCVITGLKLTFKHCLLLFVVIFL